MHAADKLLDRSGVNRLGVAVPKKLDQRKRDSWTKAEWHGRWRDVCM